MANEGSEVIKANNRRVATAKKAAALTARNLQAAQKAEDAAQKALEEARTAKKVALKEHDEASEELKDAQQAQEAALKKWEVVDLVQDDDDVEEELKISNIHSKKRPGSTVDVEDANKKARSDSDIPTEIIVEKCGTPEVNGTYKRDGIYRIAPQYSKEGQWKDEAVQIVIQRFITGQWYIRIKGQNIFFCRSEIKTFTPPSYGWNVRAHGVEPPPKITLST